MVNSIPSHIAVIMDGNSRWAKKNKLSQVKGYEQGIIALKRLLKYSLKFKIKILTVYALSTENTKRKNIQVLYSLIKKLMNKSNFDEFNNINFNLLGDRSGINNDILSFFEKLEKKQNKKKLITLNLAFNYGSWNEVEYCLLNILNKYKSINYKNIKLNETLIRNNLYSKNIPDPDILIRTGGRKRLSNFLLLQLKYTELFFTNTLWPDFNIKLFKKILEEYDLRKRTYGL